jgi:hypothetical protein
MHGPWWHALASGKVDFLARLAHCDIVQSWLAHSAFATRWRSVGTAMARYSVVRRVLWLRSGFTDDLASFEIAPFGYFVQ